MRRLQQHLCTPILCFIIFLVSTSRKTRTYIAYCFTSKKIAYYLSTNYQHFFS